ncbi:hypothetical protein GO613_01310 [Azoarcus communis]|uniref:phage tail protein n=1 Tax=Parazoarcus communis TaxID=41977 RepID=UPI001459D721|nr:hypothetical protein [Parazoarcus communis]
MKAGVRGTKELRQAASWVASIPTQAQRAAVAAVNRTVVEIRDTATRDMQGRVNLPADYIRGKLRVVRATADRPTGVVAIQRRAIRLARFGAQQLSIASPRAKGDKLRGIAKGLKQHGISVQVKVARKRLKRAFFLPLMAGTERGGNGMGIFIRTGPGPKDIEHLWGVSPDQLFRAWRDDNIRMVEGRLAANFVAELQRTIKRRG